MKKVIQALGIIFLFILSAISPLSIGLNINYKEQSTAVRDPLEEYYGVYSLEEIPENIRPVISNDEGQEILVEKDIDDSKESSVTFDGLMDSAWPMYCHDTHHTGRSPYNTSNIFNEIWQFVCGWSVEGSATIDNNGIIYFGSLDSYLYALYPNGTLKWKYSIGKGMNSGPAIDKNGTIYIGTLYSASGNYLYAINSNGSLKWRYSVGDWIYSSPAIGDDGTIFFGSNNHHIYALYKNGTLRWKYATGNPVLSSPSIAEDGTVYCGSHSTYLYALYPNNGTLKWKYKTGDWIRTSPCIADDGTIYVVSLDNYLHAVNPDGSFKWKTNVGAGTSPTIGWDGTIYAGYTNLYAINPTNGSIKWTFDVDGTMRGGTPCNSIDGIIYVGTSDGEEIIAINSDGTERWRKVIGTVEFAPVIDEKDVVYIGTSHNNVGYLHAFGQFDPYAPSVPIIIGQTNGKAGTEYEYSFKSTSPLGRDIYYYFEWGDGKIEDWFGPFSSGEEITVSHTWIYQGTYTIKARAKDTENLWGPWGELIVIMPRDKSLSSSLLLKILEKFPLLQRLLDIWRLNLL